ncbi:MAG: type III-A CRISPR-associated protein Csm2 [Bacillota bacterium]|nr:type III-A CRISPR-associated protein Csm2 [Bacillota bacterium]
MNKNQGGSSRKGSDNRAGSFPQEYLKGGYFDQEGEIKTNLLVDTASRVAKSFGHGLTTGQLRRFYGHAKTAEKAFNYSQNEKKLINDIKVLDAFVAEAYGKENVPENFYKFININTSSIENSKDIIKGFLPHFQSVVAYHTYHYGENKERRVNL